MKPLKPAAISLLALIVFIAALGIGMQTEWWQTSGRRTPLDPVNGHGSADSTEEEDHSGTVSASSSIEDALGLGITYEQLAHVLQGSVESYPPNTLIRSVSDERSLRFAAVKEELLKLIE